METAKNTNFEKLGDDQEINPETAWYKTYEASFSAVNKQEAGLSLCQTGGMRMTDLIARFIVALVEIYSKVRKHHGGDNA